MQLDIFSDTICPWCYVGKRRLARALAMRPQPKLVIRWRAFQLNPGMPPEGMERSRYIEAKFGGPDRAKRINDAVTTVGASEGLDFHFERIRHTPTRWPPIACSAWPRATTGRTTCWRRCSPPISSRAATSATMACWRIWQPSSDFPHAAAFLAHGDGIEEAKAEDALARRQGINGVPCFIFNGRFLLSGAQEPESFFQLFDLAREEEATALRESAR